MTTKQIVIIAYASWLVLLSLIAFIAYGVDKKKAEKGKWRSELTRQLNNRASWLSAY